MDKLGMTKMLLPLLLALPGVAGVATYHVSVRGHDAAAGTAEAPWRTLQRAVEALKPGDTAIAGPGTYRERMEWRRGGTPDAPLTLTAMPGTRVVVSGADLEANTRSQWLAGASGVSHVRVRGITFRHAANHAQRGAFSIGGSGRGWTIEDCVFERANGPGASFTGDGHVIRRCVFQDNGQLGFGASTCHQTRMEECGFYRNNAKGYSTGWEAGGLKITMSRGFVIERCRAVDNRGVGIWYDIGNEQSEVARCTIADNDEAGIFYEISYGLHAHDNLIVNNANLGEKPRGAWGSGGITLSSSEDCVVENNTLVGNRDGIAFREQNRDTPRIDGGERRILNKNHVIRNNLVAASQAYNVAFWMDTTFFGPHPGGHDKAAQIFEDPKTLNFRFENNLLFPLTGQPNYLYGCVWRPKSKQANTPAEFTAASGITDSSHVADPRFTDMLARDFRLLPDSPASKQGAGVREPGQIPQP